MILFACQAYPEAKITSAEVALNQARIEVQRGNVRLAINTQREGLLLDPTHPELRRDLSETRALVGYPAEVPMPADLNQWSHRIRESDLFVVFAVCVALASLGLIKWFTTRPRWAGFLSVVGLISCLAVVGLAIALERAQSRFRGIPFTVVRGAAILRTGNGESYPPRLEAVLPGGVEVTVLHERDQWVQVELPGGVVGWLRKAELLQRRAQVFVPDNVP